MILFGALEQCLPVCFCNNQGLLMQGMQGMDLILDGVIWIVFTICENNAANFCMLI